LGSLLDFFSSKDLHGTLLAFFLLSSFSKILLAWFFWLVFSFKDLQRIFMVLLGRSLNGDEGIIMVVVVVVDDAL
jgi:hypothetical protein